MSSNSFEQTNVKLGLMEKISYANGNLACSVVYGLCYGLLTYFYTNAMGVSAALVGSIFLFSRLFDGISDVVMGIIADHVHSKHGRGRAWILWMSVPYGVSAVLLFLLPAHASAAAQGVYIFITYNLCTTVVYTALNLPYGLLAPLMTSNEQEVVKLNLFRTGAGSIGMLIVLSATLPIVNRLGGDQSAWIKVSIIYACIAVGLLLWCFFGTKERVQMAAASEAENLPLRTRLKAIAVNKYFWLLMLTQFGLQFYQTIDGTCGTYYAQYILGNNEYYSMLSMAETLATLATVFVMAPLIKKFGKRNLILTGSLFIIAAELLMLTNPTSVPFATVLSAVRGVGVAPLVGVSLTMFADCINYGHWKTGVRVQALIFSAFTVGQKFGSGVMSSIIGKLMSASGFTGAAHEIAPAVAMVKNIYIWGAVLSCAMVVALMIPYHLDRDYDSMMADMEEKGMLTQEQKTAE